LRRKLITLQREEQRLIDAYQASVIDLADLKGVRFRPDVLFYAA
jgi:hypothetical protein